MLLLVHVYIYIILAHVINIEVKSYKTVDFNERRYFFIIERESRAVEIRRYEKEESRMRGDETRRAGAEGRGERGEVNHITSKK